VHHALIFAVETNASFELHLAAGVGGGDNGSARAVDRFHFVRQNLHRHLVLHDVVSAGAAAADIGAGHFFQRDTGDGGEQLAGCAADALAVREMAGVLIGHHFVHRAHPQIQFDTREEFGDVADPGGELSRSGRVGRIAGEQLAIFLEHGAAAGGVADDNVESSAAQGFNILAGQRAGIVGKTGM